jgi:hypothetical protein
MHGHDGDVRRKSVFDDVFQLQDHTSILITLDLRRLMKDAQSKTIS